MQEVVPTESPRPNELINADSIKRRTMEFFQGVDLNKVGESRIGPLTISTKSLPYISEIWHKAMLNGSRFAEYHHRLDGAAKLEPLRRDEYRQKETYMLNGHVGNGIISVSLTAYEGRPAEIRISIPGNAMNRDRKWGSVDEFTISEKEFVAEVLGIKS